MADFVFNFKTNKGGRQLIFHSEQLKDLSSVSSVEIKDENTNIVFVKGTTHG